MASRVVVAKFKVPGHSFVAKDDQGVILPPAVDHMPEEVHFGDEHYEIDEHGHVELPAEIGINAGWEQVSTEELKKLEDVQRRKKVDDKKGDDKK